MAEVTEIRDEYIEELSEALIMAYGRKPWSETWTPGQAKKSIQYTASGPASRGYAVLEDGKAVGALIGQIQLYRTYEFFINQIYVHPEYQGRGLAKKMLLHAARELSKEGITGIELITIPYDREFYEACGYEATNWLCMSKHL